MRRPRFHQRAALFQQVGPVICRFDLVRHSVRERAFCKVAGVTVLAGPITEAAAESMRRGDACGRVALRFDPAQEGRENHIAENLPARRREHQRFM